MLFSSGLNSMPVSLFDSFDTSLNSCRCQESKLSDAPAPPRKQHKRRTLNSLVPADMQSCQNRPQLKQYRAGVRMGAPVYTNTATENNGQNDSAATEKGHGSTGAQGARCTSMLPLTLQCARVCHLLRRSVCASSAHDGSVSCSMDPWLPLQIVPH